MLKNNLFTISLLSFLFFNQFVYASGKVDLKPLLKPPMLAGTIWALERLDSERVIFTEREGRIGIYSLLSNKLQWLDTKALRQSISFGGQGGLFDVLVSPSVAENNIKTLYLSFSQQHQNGSCTVLATARLDGLSLLDLRVIFISRCGSDNKRHYGGRLARVKNKLFIGIGDGGNRDQAQNLSNHAGKILRLNLDGSIPIDNPFVAVTGAAGEIYSLGHRNPQGLFYQPKKQALWSVEHGPRGGDELNLIHAGSNYGWPKYSYGKEYWGPIAVGESPSPTGFIEPSYVYIPSIAPSDFAIRPGSQQFYLSALSHKLISVLRLGPDENKEPKLQANLLVDQAMRLRSLLWLDKNRLLIGTDKQGLWLLTFTD